MSVTGAPGKGPMRVGAAVADVTAGLMAALGIMTALLERETSGEGQWVQSSLLQAGIQQLDFQAARFGLGDAEEVVVHAVRTLPQATGKKTSVRSRQKLFAFRQRPASQAHEVLVFLENPPRILAQ